LYEIKYFYEYGNLIYIKHNNYFIENFTKTSYYILYKINLIYPLKQINNDYLCPLSKKIVNDIENNIINFHCLNGEYVKSFDNLKEDIYPILNYFNGYIYYQFVYDQFLNYLEKEEYNLYD